MGSASARGWGSGSIPAARDEGDDATVSVAVGSWIVVGVVAGLVAHGLAAATFPGGIAGALLGGGAGGFLGGGTSAVLIVGAGAPLDPVTVLAAVAGAAALLATIRAADRASLRER
jgi:uncharacterized membrane protein YeaQ/YmgE (transglycosylase-associated protein family)